jgi:methanogenic corrinoid protein MtbC1
LDELTRVVLATAQRAARELRETARQEAETTLRKARRRGVDAERQLANRRERALKEIAALEATRSCLYEEMHSALESLKSALVEQRPADQPESTALRGPVARLVP